MKTGMGGEIGEWGIRVKGSGKLVLEVIWVRNRRCDDLEMKRESIVYDQREREREKSRDSEDDSENGEGFGGFRLGPIKVALDNRPTKFVLD